MRSRSVRISLLSSHCFCAILVIRGLDAFYTSHLGGNNWAGLRSSNNNPNQLQRINSQSQSQSDPDTSTSSSVCKEQNGQFADPQYCDKYYDCWEGRPVSSGQCSHGLMFNEQTASCDYPSMVNCDGKEVAQPLQDLDEGYEEAYGTFPSRYDCTQYTVCHAGRGNYYRCEQGLAFDPNMGMCAPTPEPSCIGQGPPDDHPPDEPLPEIPLDPEAIKPAPPPATGGNGDIAFPIIPEFPGSNVKCPESASTGFIPIVRDCRSVLICMNGTGYVFSCPTGQFLHPRSASCQPGRKEKCEQMDYPVVRSIQNKNGSEVKYGFLRRGYPLLPF